MCPLETARREVYETGGARRNHVLYAHYKRKLFHCGVCAYSHVSLLQSVKAHFLKCHRSIRCHPELDIKGEMAHHIKDQSTEPEHKEAIDKLVRDCFWRDRTYHSRRNRQLGLPPPVKSGDYGANESQEMVPEAPTEGGGTDTQHCLDCQRDIALENVESHIYVMHFKRVCVRCPYCDFGSRWDPSPVWFHIPAVHPGMEVRLGEDIREREDVRREYQRLKNIVIRPRKEVDGELS